MTPTRRFHITDQTCVVSFTLDGAGTTAFAQTTKKLATEPPPRNELAIIVDRKLISTPVVYRVIACGAGSSRVQLPRAERARSRDRSERGRSPRRPHL